MLLKSFRIKNFRSILNSGECYISPEITILAGKNESGKTNILAALKKFNKDEKLDDSDLPLNRTNNDPTGICLNFEINSSELDNIILLYFKERKFSFKLERGIFDLSITKFNGDSYQFSGSAIDAISEKLTASYKSKLANINGIIIKIWELLSKNVADAPEIKLLDFADSTEDNREKIAYLSSSYSNTITNVTNEKVKDKLRNLQGHLLNIAYMDGFSEIFEGIKKEIISKIPRMILFDSFDDILPYEVELNEAQGKKIVTDFSKISNLEIEELKNTSDTQKRKRIVDNASVTIDGDFKSFWNQDKVDLKVDIDGSKLLFLIYDEGEYTPFKPEQRSKGLQWFLSFYISLSAEIKKEGDIILIDEPGLYLHAKAQEDVLGVLEKHSKKNQIIFTTHMPYLINPNKLARVRLVLKSKDKNETKIENKIHKGADIEALTPIITAIGLDLSKGIGAPKENNVILEGISDYYYIQAMLTYLETNKKYKPKKDVYFIPSFGADKIPLLIPIFIGWELKYLALFDHDKKGIRVSEKLKRESIPQNNILFVSESENNSMEDLFSKKDFRRYIIKEKIKNDELNKLLNSELVKKLKFDKVLLSKNFFDNITSNTNDIEKIKLSEETEKNFISLFKKLDLAFS